MKKLSLWLQKPYAAYSFAACAAVLLYMALSHASFVSEKASALARTLSPVIVGIIFAYLLNPICDFFEQRVLHKIKKESVRHTISAILAAVCVLLVIVLLLIALIPSLIKSGAKLVNNWSGYSEKLEWLLGKAVTLGARFGLSFDLSSLSDLISAGMDKIYSFIKNNVSAIFSTVGSVGATIGNFLIGLLFGICFLIGDHTLLSVVRRIRRATVSEETLSRNNALLGRCNRIFFRYLTCTLLDAAIIGIATLIFSLIMNFPYAPLIAAVAAITNIIPTFGPIIGGALGAFFLILDKPINALWFLIFTVVLQALDAMVIKPRLFKNSLGIPAIWSLVLIILGGKIAGVLGILLAIPAGAILEILYAEIVVPRLETRRQKLNAAAPDGSAEEAAQLPE